MMGEYILGCRLVCQSAEVAEHHDLSTLSYGCRNFTLTYVRQLERILEISRIRMLWLYTILRLRACHATCTQWPEAPFIVSRVRESVQNIVHDEPKTYRTCTPTHARPRPAADKPWRPLLSSRNVDCYKLNFQFSHSYGIFGQNVSLCSFKLLSYVSVSSRDTHKSNYCYFSFSGHCEESVTLKTTLHYGVGFCSSYGSPALLQHPNIDAALDQRHLT